MPYRPPDFTGSRRATELEAIGVIAPNTDTRLQSLWEFFFAGSVTPELRKTRLKQYNTLKAKFIAQDVKVHRVSEPSMMGTVLHLARTSLATSTWVRRTTADMINMDAYVLWSNGKKNYVYTDRLSVAVLVGVSE